MLTCLIMSSWATCFAAENKLHFHAAFDGTLKAIVDGRNTVAPLNQADYEYENGPVGKAIIIDKIALIYKEAESFPLKEGTVAFWLRPHWQPGKGKSHWILQKWSAWKTNPRNGLWFIFFRSRIIAALSPASGFASISTWFSDSEWKSGQWKHLAYSWGNEGIRYYINGCLIDASNNKQCFPQKHAGKFSLGGKHNYYSGKISMDDFRVYRTSLSAKQVKKLFAMGDTKFVSASPATHQDKWNITRLPGKFANRPKESCIAWPANSYRFYSDKNSIVRDNESETKITCRTELTDKAIATLDGKAFKWALHTYGKDNKDAAINSLKIENILSVKGYHWYKLGTYTIDDSNFIWLYGINLSIELSSARNALAPTKKSDIWARIKFEGPYFKNDTNNKKNAISLEWVVAVKEERK